MRHTVTELPTIDACRLIELSKVSDERGNLTFIESARHIPFAIARVYYIYDVHSGSQRAGHAHLKLSQLLVATSGSFDVHLDDGFQQRTVTLNRPYYGLLITPMIWRIIDNFSSGAVCLALASAYYEESDYFRNYDDFLTAARDTRQNIDGRLPNSKLAEQVP